MPMTYDVLLPNRCGCGCGAWCNTEQRTGKRRRFLPSHNTKANHPMQGRKHTAEARKKIKAKRAGQTNVAGGGPVVVPSVERFFDHVTFPGTCWEWTGATNPNGYGSFGVGSTKDGTAKVVRSHRFAYELVVGPIPDGLELDHLCNNRACVNPDHLEPVTHAENIARAVKRRYAS